MDVDRVETEGWRLRCALTDDCGPELGERAFSGRRDGGEYRGTVDVAALELATAGSLPLSDPLLRESVLALPADGSCAKS